jgi:acyl-CoA thioesterase FadM
MRVKLQFPEPAVFQTQIPVRISDINYGAHVGNDSVLSILHEARMQYLQSMGYTEMNVGGCSLIMADSAIQYKGESFYGDVLQVEVKAINLSAVSFDLFYRVQTQRNGEWCLVVLAKTGMICFDYHLRKICEMPEVLRQSLSK